MRDTFGGLPWAMIGRWAAVAAAAAVLAMAVIAVLRSRVGRRGRGLRVEYALLPDPEFETSVEEVIRFAAQMGRARTATGLLHHPDADSIRLRLRSVKDGQLLTSIVMPQDAAPGLRRAMYPDVEIRPIAEVVDTDLETPGTTPDGSRADRLVNSNPDPSQAGPSRPGRPGGDDRPPPADRPPAQGGRGPVEAKPPAGPRPAGDDDQAAALWVDRDGGGAAAPLHLEL